MVIFEKKINKSGIFGIRSDEYLLITLIKPIMKKHTVKTFIFFLLSFNLLAQNSIIPEGKLYWSNQGTQKILTSNYEGENIAEIASSGEYIRRVRVDVKNEKIYWTVGGSGKIWRVGLDGSNLENILSLSTDVAVIELDSNNDKIYFTENNDGRIQVANLDGTNKHTLINGVNFVQGIDFDPYQNYLYWTEFDTGNIKRANADGSNIVTILSAGSSPFDIIVNYPSQTIYYSDRQTNAISKMNLEGANIENFIQEEEILGAISIDFYNSFIFWISTSGAGSLIKKAKLDGTEINTVIENTGENLGGLEIIPPVMVGIKRAEIDDGFKVFPNPAEHLIQLDFEGLSDDLMVLITNTKGQVVMKNVVGEINKNLNVANYPSGLYYVTIYDDKSFYTLSFEKI